MPDELKKTLKLIGPDQPVVPVGKIYRIDKKNYYEVLI